MSKKWQELYKQTKPILDRYYPQYQSAKDYARQYLNENLKQGQEVLDLGCGTHSEDFTEAKGRIKLIGVDYEESAGEINNVIDEFKQADLNKELPFTDKQFDLVYSRFVIEHIANPVNVYEEVYRVLKPGSQLVLLAPNLYNPIILANKIMPSFIQKFFKTVLTGTKEEEVFPTYYRSNTSHRIKKQLIKAGFANIKIIRKGGVFEYFMANKFLFFLGIIFEKLTNFIFKFTKLHLVVICRKPL